MSGLDFDIAHLLAGGLVLISLMMLYQDRRAPNVNGNPNVFNGNSSSTLEGALYFPSQEINYVGTTGMVR